ncbi:hypothetical protein MMC27_004044 [Xylographa pallens]|nr:hypothetical protein [Xylographa pallens]
MNTCTPPEQYYICTANGYSGCCGNNPCDEREATCPYFITTTSAAGISTVTADVPASILENTDMEDSATPDATTFDTAVISAPSSFASVMPAIVTAPAWTPAAVSTTNTLFGGALSQISVTEGVVLQFSTVVSPVATEPAAATSTSLGSFSTGITTASPPSSSPGAVIAGGVVAAIIMALLISVLICWLRMHHRKRGSQYQKSEKADIVVQTLFDVPPSEVFGDFRATSAEKSTKHKTGGGIFAFINRRLTMGGEANVAPASTDKRHTRNDSAERDVAFTPMAASIATEERRITSDVANVTPESTDRRHTTRDKNPAYTALNPMAASLVTDKRQTTGGMADMISESTEVQPTVTDNAEITNAHNSMPASKITDEQRTTGIHSSVASNTNAQRHTIGGIADANMMFTSKVASDLATKRHTTDGIAAVVPEVIKRRHAAGLTVETNSDINNKRHTVGGVPRVASEVTNKRHTTG